MKTGYALWNLVGDKALSKPSVLLEAPAEGSDHGGSVAEWEGAGGCCPLEPASRSSACLG